MNNNLNYEILSLEKKLSQQEQLNSELYNKLVESSKKIETLQKELQLKDFQHQNYLNRIFQSTSWKITAPIRKLKELLNKPGNNF